MWIYCGFIVNLLWIYYGFMSIYVDLCRLMRIYGGFMRIYFPKMDLWCTQFWADVYPSQNTEQWRNIRRNFNLV